MSEVATEIEFAPFPKIARLFRDVIITEKIDGTNAAVGVTEDGRVYAQSRKRLIFPGNDNFGFAAWVADNEDELRQLGPGLHFGEWWGLGIQRGYGLDEKRFSLFNVSRWSNKDGLRPACCGVVPTVARAENFHTERVHEAMGLLASEGSYAAPGFMKPEGVVVFHPHANKCFKVTFEDDHKGVEHGA